MKFRSNPNFINATLPSNLRITNLIHAIRSFELLARNVNTCREQFRLTVTQNLTRQKHGKRMSRGMATIVLTVSVEFGNAKSSPRIPPQGFPLAVSLSMRCRIQESRRVNDGTFESSKFASARFSRGRIQFRTLANR